MGKRLFRWLGKRLRIRRDPFSLFFWFILIQGQLTAAKLAAEDLADYKAGKITGKEYTKRTATWATIATILAFIPWRVALVTWLAYHWFF